MAKDERRRAEYSSSARRLSRELKEIAYGERGNLLINVAERLLEMSREITEATLTASVPSAGMIADVANLLDALGVRYVVIGGLAVNVHGHARGTDDVDLLVERMPDPSLVGDVEFMRAYRFYPSRSRTGTILTLDHRDVGGVELLLADNACRRRALDTAEPAALPGATLPVVTPEALVALKVQAVRSNPSRTKDRSDIVSVAGENDLDESELALLLDTDELETLRTILPRA